MDNQIRFAWNYGLSTKRLMRAIISQMPEHTIPESWLGESIEMQHDYEDLYRPLWGWLNELAPDQTYGYLAVYGTLRKGGRLHRSYLCEADYIATTRLPGDLYMLKHAGFPIADYNPEVARSFVCEIYNVPAQRLADLYCMEVGVGVYKGITFDYEGVPTGLFTTNEYGHEYMHEGGYRLKSGDFECTGLLSTQPSMTFTNTAPPPGTSDTSGE